jgi:hypothetical protein
MAAKDETQWRWVHMQNYVSAARNWRNWFNAADELQHAVDLLRPQVTGWWAGVVQWRDSKERPRKFPALGCHSIAMMLMAFVVENLCKGALIRDGAVDISTERLAEEGLPKAVTTHNLRALVRAIKMPTDDKEQELLTRMTRSSRWRGRYPVPVSYEEAIHSLVVDDGKKYSASWFGANDLERMEALVVKIRLHVGAERSFTVSRDAGPY